MHLTKLAKGLIAGGLGLALLLGGGTFALWSDSAAVDGGSIASGTLDVAPVAATTKWFLNGSETALTPTELAGLLIVPGDSLKLNTDLTVTAIGTNLEAELSVDPATMTETGGTALLGILQDPANSVLTVTGAGGPLTAVAGKANTFQVPISASAQLMHASLTITFPTSTANQIAQGESVDLTGLTFSLDQV